MKANIIQFIFFLGFSTSAYSIINPNPVLLSDDELPQIGLLGGGSTAATLVGPRVVLFMAHGRASDMGWKKFHPHNSDDDKNFGLFNSIGDYHAIGWDRYKLKLPNGNEIEVKGKQYVDVRFMGPEPSQPNDFNTGAMYGDRMALLLDSPIVDIAPMNMGCVNVLDIGKTTAFVGVGLPLTRKRQFGWGKLNGAGRDSIQISNPEEQITIDTGDSGGPHMKVAEDGSLQLIGVTSTGSRNWEPSYSQIPGFTGPFQAGVSIFSKMLYPSHSSEKDCRKSLNEDMLLHFLAKTEKICG